MPETRSQNLPLPNAARHIAELLAVDLCPLGAISTEPRFDGVALLEDGVMFGYVDADGTPYLQANETTAAHFHGLGSTRHPQMSYWSIPQAVSGDLTRLREAAHEAVDFAHLAYSFDLSGRYACTEPAAEERAGRRRLTRLFSSALFAV